MAAKMPSIARSIARSAALIVVVLACSTAARAANDCPWLNEATASSILGGDATGLYVPAAAGRAASCTFTQTSSEATRELAITVEIAASPHDRVVELVNACKAPSAPVASIGNEAMRCAAVSRGRAHGEQIIGRVRDQVFIIAITTTAKQDPVLDEHELGMRSQTAAEQVTGSLF
jgi:hypothetical protein